MEALIADIGTHQTRKSAELDRRIRGALSFFGLNENDVAKGLTHLKRTTKKRFAEVAKQYHPDTYTQYHDKRGYHRFSGRVFRDAYRAKEIIMRLKVAPMTPENMISVLELQKGYLTTEDVDGPYG